MRNQTVETPGMQEVSRILRTCEKYRKIYQSYAFSTEPANMDRFQNAFDALCRSTEQPIRKIVTVPSILALEQRIAMMGPRSLYFPFYQNNVQTPIMQMKKKSHYWAGESIVTTCFPNYTTVFFATKSSVRGNEGLLGSSGWRLFAAYHSMQECGVNFEEELNTKMHYLEEICRSIGPVYTLTDSTCYVCERPTLYKTDAQGRLHCADGPAMQYTDGSKQYSWHGTEIPNWIVEHPENIDVHDIMVEWNMEVRRAMMEIYGHEKFLESGYLHFVSEDRYGRLYRPDERLLLASRESTYRLVRVINSTPEPDGSFHIYYLKVPPHIQTPHEGVAWTYKLTPQEYSPLQET